MFFLIAVLVPTLGRQLSQCLSGLGDLKLWIHQDMSGGMSSLIPELINSSDNHQPDGPIALMREMSRTLDELNEAVGEFDFGYSFSRARNGSAVCHGVGTAFGLKPLQTLNEYIRRKCTPGEQSSDYESPSEARLSVILSPDDIAAKLEQSERGLRKFAATMAEAEPGSETSFELGAVPSLINRYFGVVENPDAQKDLRVLAIITDKTAEPSGESPLGGALSELGALASIQPDICQNLNLFKDVKCSAETAFRGLREVGTALRLADVSLMVLVPATPEHKTQDWWVELLYGAGLGNHFAVVETSTQHLHPTDVKHALIAGVDQLACQVLNSPADPGEKDRLLDELLKPVKTVAIPTRSLDRQTVRWQPPRHTRDMKASGLHSDPLDDEENVPQPPAPSPHFPFSVIEIPDQRPSRAMFFGVGAASAGLIAVTGALAAYFYTRRKEHRLDEVVTTSAYLEEAEPARAGVGAAEFNEFAVPIHDAHFNDERLPEG